MRRRAPRAVGGHDEEPAGDAPREDDPLAVGRPGRLSVVVLRRGQTPRPAAVGAHRVEVERPAPLARERDRAAVRRPRGLGLEEEALRRRGVDLGVGQPLLVAAARAQGVDRIVAVARADEEEIRIEVVGAAARGEQEEQGEERPGRPHA